MNYFYILIVCFNFSVANTMVLQEAKAESFFTYALYKAAEFDAIAHVVKMPVHSAKISLVPAIGQRESVSSIAKRTGAFIAINGSNYRRGGNYNGNRVNLFCLNNTVYSDLGHVRGALCWTDKTKNLSIDTLFLDVQFTINGMLLPISSINQPRAVGQIALYTDVADTALLAYTPGKIILIDNNNCIVSVSTQIPKIIPNGYLACQLDLNAFSNIEVGMQSNCTFTLRSVETNALYTDYDFALGGAGLLIKNGVLLVDNLYKEFSQGGAIVHCSDEIAADFITKEMQELLIELRHPRTAVGITEQNEIVLVTVGGRQKQSEGLTLKELALFMQQLGCVHALNLGGGGCSTLWLNDRVVNSPCAGQERPVSEALCFM